MTNTPNAEHLTWDYFQELYPYAQLCEAVLLEACFTEEFGTELEFFSRLGRKCFAVGFDYGRMEG